MRNALVTAMLAAAVGVGVIALWPTESSPIDAAQLRVATCAVRLKDECRQRLGVRQKYLTVHVPALALDGGLRPPEDVLSCVEFIADDCALGDCAKAPLLCGAPDGGRWLTPDGGLGLTRASPSEWAHVIPDCRRPDGVWDDKHAPVDCLVVGPRGLEDGGPRWAGCNVLRRSEAVGTRCIPVPSGSVVMGDRIEDEIE